MEGMHLGFRGIAVALLGLFLLGIAGWLVHEAIQARQLYSEKRQLNRQLRREPVAEYPQLRKKNRDEEEREAYSSVPSYARGQAELLLPDTRQILLDGMDAHVLCNGTQPGLAPFLYESSLLERKLPPAAAKEILDLWNAVAEVAIDDCSARDMSLCFEPVFGLQFSYKTQPILSVTICWGCGGIRFKTPYQEFFCRMQAEAEAPRLLRQRLESVFPGSEALRTTKCPDLSDPWTRGGFGLTREATHRTEGSK